jgi:L,D-peptidoglycan transpeptidase YkuD (ErfK/YbiS/YcfS/YnhG family)
MLACAVAGWPLSGRAGVVSHVMSVTAAAAKTTGILRFGSLRVPCALGRAGLVRAKREGDGGTPLGSFALREIWYRADRIAKPATSLPVRTISRDDGWCDAPESADYNRHVRLPYRARAESLWREDRLYDLLAVVGFNDAPVRPYAGSAIFLHVADVQGGALQSTSGCVALRLDDLVTLLAACDRDTRLRTALI